MNWKSLWITLFGTTKWLGVDIGFWVSMAISLFVAIAMIVGFRNTKPFNSDKDKNK